MLLMRNWEVNNWIASGSEESEQEDYKLVSDRGGKKMTGYIEDKRKIKNNENFSNNIRLEMLWISWTFCSGSITIVVLMLSLYLFC